MNIELAVYTEVVRRKCGKYIFGGDRVNRLTVSARDTVCIVGIFYLVPLIARDEQTVFGGAEVSIVARTATTVKYRENASEVIVARFGARHINIVVFGIAPGNLTESFASGRIIDDRRVII